MLQRIFSLNKEHFLRGLSPSEYYDGGKVLYEASGIDLFRTPGRLRAGFDVSIIGSDTITGQITSFAHPVSSSLSVYAAGHELDKSSGNIYEITPSAVTIEHTVTVSGNMSLATYKGNLIYTQKTQIGSYNWATFNDTAIGGPSTLEDFDYHPLKVGVDNKLYIGNKYKLAKWDGTTLTANRLTFESDFQIRGIESDGFYLVIGGTKGGNPNAPNRIYIYFWDMVSNQVSRTFEILGPSILYNLLYYNGYIYAFCGTAIFKCSFDSPPVMFLQKHGSRTDASDRWNNMKAACNFQGTMLFGAAIGASNHPGTISRIGSESHGVPDILQTPTKFSHENLHTQILSPRFGGFSNFYIGIASPGAGENAKLYMWPKAGTSNSLTGVYAKSPFIDLGRFWKLHFLKVTTETLASGDSLTVSLKTKSGGAEILKATTFTYAADGAKTSKLFPIDGTIADQVQFNITFTAGNVQIKSIELFGEPLEELMTN